MRVWVARLAEEGGGKGEAPNVKSPIRLAAAFSAVALAAAVTAISGSANTRVSAGGTLKVGWEQSFGFTDGFDPTGEYLGDAFGIGKADGDFFPEHDGFGDDFSKLRFQFLG